MIGWRFFSPLVRILAGFLTAASPLMIYIEQLALADYLFDIALLAATVLLAEATLKPGRRPGFLGVCLWAPGLCSGWRPCCGPMA